MTELEKKAIDVIRNHSHKLIDNFTQEDLENREISIFLAGYHEGNKANEWHEIESKISPKREISKKYMPKNEEKVLLKYHFYDDNEVHISDGYYDAYDFQFHIANNPKFRIVCVIAWKEIKENER